MELEGTVTGGMIVPDTGTVSLDEGMRVKITTPIPNSAVQKLEGVTRMTLAELLKDFKGVVDDLPCDYSAQLDSFTRHT